MYYHYKRGVITPFVQKYLRLIILAIAGIFIFSQTVLFVSPTKADDLGPIDFESYSLGSVDGQDGWSSTGPFDQEVVTNTYGISEFGSQTFRISNAVTSGSFGDQTFTKSLVDEAGEPSAENGSLSGGTRQPHFEAQFDFASTMQDHQPGLFMSVSPDRGDGARMSYLGFEDTVGGIDVIFFDVQDENVGFQVANFVGTTVATGLSRNSVHTAKFVMDFVAGSSNDVVKIYIDDTLVHTGTSWENYFRFDTESQGNPHDSNLENKSRTVDSLLFRVSGGSAPDTSGNGYLIDNVGLASSNFVNNDGKVRICHATDSAQNPYNSIEVDTSAIDGDGGNDHSNHTGPVFDPDVHNQQNRGWGDIVPPVPGVNDGQNWSDEGIAFWLDNCGDEPAPRNAATVIAHKIVCDDEAKLPDDGYSSVGPDTAQDFVNQNEGCDLEENWDYQYRLSGSSSPEPTGYGELDGWETFTNSEHIPLSGNTTIQLREVLPEGYIPFTGQHSDDSVSAEFYCHTDAANYDNWEWVSSPKEGETYYCVAWNVEKPVTVLGTKIVCDTEDRLPNWGNGQTGPATIGATTADDWLAEDDNDDHCDKVAWDFEWKMDPTNNPGDNTGPAGDGWTPFDAATGVELSPAQQGDSTRIWIREVWNDNYIPFTGQNTTQDVSAELYCGSDILNYDNWDFIDNPEPGQSYHCVAWNVEQPDEFNIHAAKVVCDTEADLPNWGDGEPASLITANTAQRWVNASDGACQLARWQFQWAPNTANPGDDQGEAGDPWHTFANSATLTEADLAGGDRIWVREVFNNDYIPFGGPNTTNHESAELYCNTDILNYDNFDFILNPKPDEDYYCVGFNVLKPAVLSVVKIVCDSEDRLPNWGDGEPAALITSNTADRWLNADDNSEHCQKVDWDFQWGTPANGDPDDNTGEIAGWNTFNDTTTIWLGESGDDLRVREVWNDNYIPFTGQNTTEDVSAELYCGNDILHYDNWEWLDNVEPGGNYYCLAWNVEKPVTVLGTKIVCDSEDRLPNWGNGQTGPDLITSNTATRWLNIGDNSEHCDEVAWDFEWKMDPTNNPGDNTGPAGDGWTTFDAATGVELTAADQGDSDKVWIREVWNEEYIPFSGQNTTNDVSAELYCGEDILNYDNWDFIDNIQPGDIYHCVAWNVEVTGQIQGLVYNDANSNEQKDPAEDPLADRTVWLLTHNSPWFLHAVTTTNAGGEYLFENLSVPGTYYVCQDIQDGWFQTELNNAGLGGIDASLIAVGSQIGSDPDPALDTLIANFCYSIDLSLASPISVANDFGSLPNVQGTTDTRDPGQVLADTTGTLGKSGQPAWVMLILGLTLITTAGATRRSVKKHS